MATQKTTGNHGFTSCIWLWIPKKIRGGRKSYLDLLIMGWNAWLPKRQRVILVPSSRIWLWIPKRFRGGREWYLDLLIMGWNPWLRKRQWVILVPSSRIWLWNSQKILRREGIIIHHSNHGLKFMATQKTTGNPGSSLPHLTLNSKKISRREGIILGSFNQGLEPMATQKTKGNPGSILPHLTLNSEKRKDEHFPKEILTN